MWCLFIDLLGEYVYEYSARRRARNWPVAFENVSFPTSLQSQATGLPAPSGGPRLGLLRLPLFRPRSDEQCIIMQTPLPLRDPRTTDQRCDPTQSRRILLSTFPVIPFRLQKQ